MITDPYPCPRVTASSINNNAAMTSFPNMFRTVRGKSQRIV